MKETDYIALIQKKLLGRLNPEEQQRLQSWMQADDHARTANDLEQIWEMAGRYREGYEADVDAGLSALHRKMEGAAPVRRRIPLLAVAATFLLLIAAGITWWSVIARPLVFQAGQNDLETVDLPDGSRVTLRAGSRLVCAPTLAQDGQRTATLEGEAFFRVVHDAGRPFTVEANGARVRVLGTTFNLRAIPGEATTEVTVETGSVALEEGGESIVLQAGEQGVRDTAGRLRRRSAASLNALSWMTGRLSFQKTALPEAVSALERHYAIQIEFPAALAGCSLTADFEQYPLPVALETLETVFSGKFSQLGPDRYRLAGGACR